MSAIVYLKQYQGHGHYRYAKVWGDRHPPLSEVINFLHTTPVIEHWEYDLDIDEDQIAFQALFEVWEWIDEAEFKRATAGAFQLFIDGKSV